MLNNMEFVHDLLNLSVHLIPLLNWVTILIGSYIFGRFHGRLEIEIKKLRLEIESLKKEVSQKFNQS